MFEIGRMNLFQVHDIDGTGAWLMAGREKLLLPSYEVTEELKKGDTVKGFVYGDAEGKPIVTLRQPLAEVGEFALMQASQINEHGAFMSWGLYKDLLVPLKEQPEPMKPGRRYLVRVRLDRQGRPIGTARVEKCLTPPDDSITEGQQVDLVVWQFTPLGAKVIVNHRFGGLLYRDEIGDRLKYGDTLKAYVRHVRSDGKLDLTLSLAEKSGRDDAKAKIMRALTEHQGFLPLHDGSSPDQVRQLLGLSKKLFKKGVGGLYKAGLVELSDQGVRLKE